MSAEGLPESMITRLMLKLMSHEGGENLLGFAQASRRPLAPEPRQVYQATRREAFSSCVTHKAVRRRLPCTCACDLGHLPSDLMPKVFIVCIFCLFSASCFGDVVVMVTASTRCIIVFLNCCAIKSLWPLRAHLYPQRNTERRGWCRSVFIYRKKTTKKNSVSYEKASN